jgi:hypothetical protein
VLREQLGVDLVLALFGALADAELDNVSLLREREPLPGVLARRCHLDGLVDLELMEACCGWVLTSERRARRSCRSRNFSA